MKKVSPRLRLSAAHFFSGVSIDCVIGPAEIPENLASATIRFVLGSVEPALADDGVGQAGLPDGTVRTLDFEVSVAEEASTPARCLISCHGTGDPDRHRLDRCYREALGAADDYGARVAIVPVPSSGGTPEERVRTAVRAVRQLASSFEHIRSIRFVAEDELTFRAFRRRLAKQSGRGRPANMSV